jgi:predicted amidohydrolase
MALDLLPLTEGVAHRPETGKVAVALVQVASPDAESPASRRDRVAGMLDGLDDVDLVVLPELWPTGYQGLAWSSRDAEPFDGPTLYACRHAARERDMFVAGGSFLERAADGRLFNTGFVVNPHGRVVHVYRKIHLFGYQSQEADVLSPGDAMPVTDLPFGRLGEAICYDLRFPGVWDWLGRHLPELIVLPASWPGARVEHWRVLTTARAIEAQAYVLACNATKAATTRGAGAGGGCGLSRVIDPTGVVVAEAGAEEAVLRASIDLALVRQIRAEFPTLADRRDLPAEQAEPGFG